MFDPSHPPAITVIGLRKSFSQHTVLNGIALHVAAGTVFSLLGPNRAGKTTAVNNFTTVIRADAGQVLGTKDIRPASSQVAGWQQT